MGCPLEPPCPEQPRTCRSQQELREGEEEEEELLPENLGTPGIPDDPLVLCSSTFPAVPVPREQLRGTEEPPAHPPKPLKTKIFELQLKGFRLDSETAKPRTARAQVCVHSAKLRRGGGRA